MKNKENEMSVDIIHIYAGAYVNLLKFFPFPLFFFSKMKDMFPRRLTLILWKSLLWENRRRTAGRFIP